MNFRSNIPLPMQLEEVKVVGSISLSFKILSSFQPLSLVLCITAGLADIAFALMISTVEMLFEAPINPKASALVLVVA